jgi:hypothetical protein
MSRDDEQCMKLGKMVVRMIRDLASVPPGVAAYGRRGVTFPGGEVTLFVVKDSRLADCFDAAAGRDYAVESITPKSQTN